MIGPLGFLLDLDVFAIAGGFNSCLDLRHEREQRLESGEGKLNDRNLPSAKVLLIPQILVGRDEHVKRSVDELEKISVLDARPPQILHSHNFVVCKLKSEGMREVLVKNDLLHAPAAGTLRHPAD